MPIPFAGPIVSPHVPCDEVDRPTPSRSLVHQYLQNNVAGHWPQTTASTPRYYKRRLCQCPFFSRRDLMARALNRILPPDEIKFSTQHGFEQEGDAHRAFQAHRRHGPAALPQRQRASLQRRRAPNRLLASNHVHRGCPPARDQGMAQGQRRVRSSSSGQAGRRHLGAGCVVTRHRLLDDPQRSS